MFNNSTETIRHGSYIFYYVYDFLPQNLVDSLVKCVEVDTNTGVNDEGWEIEYMKEYPSLEMVSEDWRKWSTVLGVTDDLPLDFLKKQDFWDLYHTKLEFYLKKYLEESDQLNLNLEWASTWFLRSKNHSQQELDRFHMPYNESKTIYVDKQNHTHLRTHVVGCVYYLKSPSPDYGTAIELDGKKFISPGRENSILFFDPRIPHSRTLPSPEIGKYPRHTVITDYRIHEPMHVLNNMITKMRERGVTRRWEKLAKKNS